MQQQERQQRGSALRQTSAFAASPCSAALAGSFAAAAAAFLSGSARRVNLPSAVSRPTLPKQMAQVANVCAVNSCKVNCSISCHRAASTLSADWQLRWMPPSTEAAVDEPHSARCELGSIAWRQQQQKRCCLSDDPCADSRWSSASLRRPLAHHSTEQRSCYSSMLSTGLNTRGTILSCRAAPPIDDHSKRRLVTPNQHTTMAAAACSDCIGSPSSGAFQLRQAICRFVRRCYSQLLPSLARGKPSRMVLSQSHKRSCADGASNS